MTILLTDKKQTVQSNTQSKLSKTAYQFLQNNLALFKLLNSKQKWQLWISDKPVLKKEWLEFFGLDKSKISSLISHSTDRAMSNLIKAIKSKNFSSIVITLEHPFSDEQKKELRELITHPENKTYLFVITPNKKNGK